MKPSKSKPLPVTQRGLALMTGSCILSFALLCVGCGGSDPPEIDSNLAAEIQAEDQAVEEAETDL